MPTGYTHEIKDGISFKGDKSRFTKQELGKQGKEDINPQQVYAGKVPPHSKELEMNLLGGIMIDNVLLDVIIPILKPPHFYFSANALIYETMCLMHDQHIPIDTITITNELIKSGQLEAVGGPFYLAELSNAFSSHDTIVYSAEQILEHWVKRDIILMTYSLNEQAYDPTITGKDLLDKTEKQIMEVSGSLYRVSDSSAAEMYEDTMEHVMKARESGKDITGIASGYDDLDALTSGFQKSELIIIAGRPSHGKSALALNIAINASIRNGEPVGIFSIEMSKREYSLRMLASECRVPIENLKSGRLTDEQNERLVSKSGKVKKAPLRIDDSASLTLMEMRSKTRRWVSEHGIKMVMVDYLQLMEGESWGRSLDRHLQVAYITRGLKQLAKELDIPVVALSQLSRKIEDRGGKEKRPQLSDLRESGSIEQDADVVIFINRPEIYLSKDDPKFDQVRGLAEIIVGKQRNGPIGDRKLTFLAQYARFESYVKQGSLTPEGQGVKTYSTDDVPF